METKKLDPSETKNFTIFIVDDNEFTLRMIVKKLRLLLKCRVRGFTSAEECIIHLHVIKPHLILSDYYLDSDFSKKMDGDRLLSYIKEHYPDTAVIMYSSQNDLDLAIKLLKMGANDFLIKEKTFFENLEESVTKQLRRLKNKYEEKGLILRIFALIALISTFIVVFHYLVPDGLPFLVLGVVIIVFLFNLVAINRSMDKEKHSL